MRVLDDCRLVCGVYCNHGIPVHICCHGGRDSHAKLEGTFSGPPHVVLEKEHLLLLHLTANYDY